MSGPDWGAIRQEFPSLTGRTFLNSATFGQLPRASIAAVQQHLEHRQQTAALDFLKWFDELDELRALIAQLVHATADDIAFVPTAGHALSLATSAVDWQPGDEVLTLHNEFPNQLYGHAAVGARAEECDWNELENRLTPQTKLVALSTVNYSTGLRPELGPWIQELRRRNIVVYIDGTQSAGALDFDFVALQPDFFAVDAYKWMISPNGAAFVAVHPDMRKRLQPNVIGWRSDKDWRNVTSLHHGAPRFSATAEKYEPGMLPFAMLWGMRASLQLIAQIGIPEIEARVLGLAGLVRTELKAMGAEFYTEAGRLLPSQIVAAKLPGVDSAKLAEKLAEQAINISARRGFLRISPHFYNNDEDIGRLVSAIVS